jgi:capsular exopolysaccharide synthesis family protein
MTQPNSIITEIERIAADRLSGVLSLLFETNTVQVHFQEGLISAAATDVPRFKIGRFLSVNGFIPETDIDALVRESQDKKLRLGEFAVSKHLLDDEDLREIVREQAVNILIYALSEGFEVGPFQEISLLLNSPARMSPSQLMLEIARRKLQPYMPEPDKMIVLSNGHNLRNLTWYPQELAVIDKLRFQQSLPELAVSTGMEYARLGKILSVLNHMHMISMVAEAPSPATTALAPRRPFSFEDLVVEIDRSAVSNKIEVFHNYLSLIGEQFKTLKVRIQELSVSGPMPKVIVVSSPHAQEGKSLVSTNLALCFAKDPGKRVILLDCDLRNPNIHKNFGTTLEPGLCGYLTEDNMQPYCYMRRLDRLYMITAGGMPENPVEILSLDKTRQLIEHLKRDFDLIIIDTPPLIPVSDAQIIAKLADGMLLVVRSGKTSYSHLEQSLKAIQSVRLLGLILNDVEPRKFHTNYDYRYYHHYGYGYGSSPKPRRRSKTYFE